MTDMMTKACPHVNQTNPSKLSWGAAYLLGCLYIKEGAF